MLTAIIFIAAYAVVAVGRVPGLRIDRTGAALIGGLLMIVTGAIDLESAARAVDPRTMVLLFSMMIIVAFLRLSGGLSAAALWIGTRISHPQTLVALLVFAAGILSALFVNDTVCLVFTPIVVQVVQSRALPPLPFLLALATASNIGSAATITGNPQNILIGALSGISFNRFLLQVGPVSLILLALDVVLICALFHRELARPPLAAVDRRVRVHRVLLVKTLLVAAGVMSAFLLGVDTAIAAAGGAAVLLVTRRVRPTKIYRAVDWDLLILFAGLFVLVASAEKAGFDKRLFDWLARLRVDTVAGLTFISALMANTISNVPAVMLLSPIVPKLPNPEQAWVVLGAASTFAGNMTILGSIANLIVVEGARRHGIVIKFWDYARIGLALSAVSLLLTVFWFS